MQLSSQNKQNERDEHEIQSAKIIKQAIRQSAINHTKNASSFQRIIFNWTNGTLHTQSTSHLACHKFDNELNNIDRAVGGGVSETPNRLCLFSVSPFVKHEHRTLFYIFKFKMSRRATHETIEKWLTMIIWFLCSLFCLPNAHTNCDLSTFHVYFIQL